MVSTTMASARDRCFPVDEAFAGFLPDAGLVRGRVIGCTGPAGVSLAIALAARAVTAGSWLAAVGMPMLGVEAAEELGIPLTRLVAVGIDQRPATWAERVGAVADGFDLIVTQPPVGAERVARKVRQRLQARGAVMFALAPTTLTISCDYEFSTTAVEWAGMGVGHGALMGRKATVRAGGRRIPRPLERDLWLPGPNGRVATVEPAQPIDVRRDRSDVAVVELSRAG